LLTGFTDVDSTFEERAIFNRDARGYNVASKRTVAANINAIAGSQVAPNFPEHDDLAGIDIGGNYAVASNCHAVSGKVD
jgi:hypothetical protein